MEQELGDISSEQILSMAGGESSEDTHVKGIQVSEDGKWYVIAVENGNEDGNVQFMMYEKTSDGLKKQILPQKIQIWIRAHGKEMNCITMRMEITAGIPMERAVSSSKMHPM